MLPIDFSFQSYRWDMLLIGLIWLVALGFAAGNYACSLVHRLPRGRGILEKKPYCGSCGTMLATKDLFPVFSALFLRHKCRYCAAPIPMSHFWTELSVGGLFCLCFLRFNFSEQYLVVAALGTLLIVLTSIHHNENGLVEKRVMAVALAIGMLLRTLADGSLYGFFFGGLYGAIVGAILWRRQITKVGHIYVLPLNAQLLALGGVCAGERGFLLFLAFFALFALAFYLLDTLFKRDRRMTVMLPFSLAVVSTVML